MRGIGGELGYTKDGILNARQHFIQSVGETLQFVAGLQVLQAVAQIAAGNLPGSVRPGIDRKQCSPAIRISRYTWRPQPRSSR